MKNITVIFLFFLNGLYAQNKKVTTYQSFGDTTNWKISKVAYYQGFHLVKETFDEYYLTASSHEGSFLKEYVYSKDNLYSKSTAFNKDSSVFIIENYYNKWNLLMVENKYSCSKGNQQQLSCKILDYDISRKISNETYSRTIGNDYTLVSNLIYYYNKQSATLDSITNYAVPYFKEYVDDYTCCGLNTQRKIFYNRNGQIEGHGPYVTEIFKDNLLIEKISKNDKGWSESLKYEYDKKGRLVRATYYEYPHAKVFQKIIYE